MGKTKIQWTDVVWNPVRGCSRVSEGCRHCYAEKMAARFCGPGQPYEGLANPIAPRDHMDRVGGRRRGWTGKVRLVPEHLHDPLRWKRPRKVFVNSMSDLFHEALPDAAIDEVLAVMLVSPSHTFQVLTKRAARMRAYFAAPDLYERALTAAGRLRVTFRDRCAVAISNPGTGLPPWIWLGVSVEDQRAADERIPHLLATPAAVRWVSYEPAIGPIDFTHLDADRAGHAKLYQIDALTGRNRDMGRPCPDAPSRLDWIVVGGESGPDARPFDLAWARETVRACRGAAVPCFVKQIGDHARGDTLTVPDRSSGAPMHLYVRRWILDDESEWVPPLIGAHVCERPVNAVGFRPSAHHGATPEHWPEDLRVREWPRVGGAP